LETEPVCGDLLLQASIRQRMSHPPSNSKENAMSSVIKPKYLTHEEYFAIEQQEDQRYEYIAGEIFAMAGGSENHSLISMSIGSALLSALSGKPCRVYNTDMKLYVREYDKFCYPDVQVLCDQGIRHGTYVENPVLLVEVLSDSTESYDRNKKFEHYRSIESLKYYLLVDQTRKHVELYEKESKDRWIVAYPKDQLILKDLDITVNIEEIYGQVEFTATNSAF
jgi:Uma2 family endonuclease